MFMDSWTIKQLYQKVSGIQPATIGKISKSGLTLGLCNMSFFQLCIHNLQMDAPVWLDWEGPGVWRWSPPLQTACLSSPQRNRQDKTQVLVWISKPSLEIQTRRRESKRTGWKRSEHSPVLVKKHWGSFRVAVVIFLEEPKVTCNCCVLVHFSLKRSYFNTFNLGYSNCKDVYSIRSLLLYRLLRTPICRNQSGYTDLIAVLREVWVIINQPKSPGCCFIVSFLPGQNV